MIPVLEPESDGSIVIGSIVIGLRSASSVNNPGYVAVVRRLLGKTR